MDQAESGIRNPSLSPLLAKSRPGLVLKRKGSRLYTNEIAVRPSIQCKKSLLNLRDRSKQESCKKKNRNQALLTLR